MGGHHAILGARSQDDKQQDDQQRDELDPHGSELAPGGIHNRLILSRVGRRNRLDLGKYAVEFRAYWSRAGGASIQFSCTRNMTGPLVSHMRITPDFDAAETRQPTLLPFGHLASGPISIHGKRIAAGGAEPGQVAPPALSVARSIKSVSRDPVPAVL